MITPKTKCPVCSGSKCKCPLIALPVFAGVPKAAWDVFCKRRVANVYKKGNIVFYDGNQPLGMYFVCNGRVKIVKSESGIHSNITRVVEGPDLLGDRALLANEPYRGSGEVMEEARVCFLDRESFDLLMLGAPGVARHLLVRMAKELGRAEERILDLAFKTARARLAKYIVGKIPAAAASGSGPSQIKFAESRTELAKILDTSPEALCRTLAEFKSKGWIAVEGHNIRVLNKGKLTQVAQF